MTRQRRHFTPEQKVALLREHFLDEVPVSDLCEKYDIAVTFFSGLSQIVRVGQAARSAQFCRVCTILRNWAT